mmetsp:Transcript_86848/g.137754  ORF Transcript_86848/g.137754 Transcript_86848/m.137754 type:complete len:266 (+) Transcript_86848:655-1452(+)
MRSAGRRTCTVPILGPWIGVAVCLCHSAVLRRGVQAGLGGHAAAHQREAIARTVARQAAAGNLEVRQDAQTHLKSASISPVGAPGVQAVPIVGTIAHHRNGMVGIVVAAMGIDPTGVCHETGIRVEICGNRSTTQQGFPRQVVHPLWEGVLIAGNGDVVGSRQPEFVLAHGASKVCISALRRAGRCDSTHGEMLRAIPVAKVGMAPQVASCWHTCVGHQVKDPVGPSPGAAIAVVGHRAGRHEAPRELRPWAAEDTLCGDAKPGV